MPTMSVSGVVSGMDWESMISSIIEKASQAAYVQVDKKTNLTNKKSLFEEMKVTMNSLQSSLSSLRMPSTYKAKEVEIERIDKNGSHKGVLTATVNADAEVNVYDLKVNRLATAQTNRSKQITSSTLSSTLVGLTGGTIYVNAAGQKVGIEVSSSDSLQSLKSKINTKLKTLDNPIKVTASVVDNKLILKSDYTGLGTLTAEETIKYNGTGTNTLTSMIIDDDKKENFIIKKDSKQYKVGKDFDIANGNEIRWKQYNDTYNVKLNDPVTATYTLAEGDSITKSGFTTAKTVNVANTLGFTPNSYKNLKITTDSATYTYGTDFTVDNRGNIEWIENTTTSAPSSVKVSYDFGGTDFSVSFNGGDYQNENISTLSGGDVQPLASLGLDTFTHKPAADVLTHVTEEYGKAAFTLTKADGTSFGTYGENFAVRSANPNQARLVIVYPKSSYWPNDGLPSKDQDTASPHHTNDPSLTLRYNSSYSTTADFSDGMTVASALGFTPLDYSKVKVSDADGNEYTLGTDYEIDSSTGAIKWLGTTSTTANKPDDDEEFNLTYTAGNAITDNKSLETGTVFYGNKIFSQVKLLASDEGDFVDNGKKYLSMTQVEKDLAEHEMTLADAFTIKDSTGKEYVYGTDYTISGGGNSQTLPDGSIVTLPLIFWNNLPADTNFTIVYSGRGAATGEPETINLNVTRTNYDSIASIDSRDIPTSEKLNSGTVTITQGDKTYYKGIDFTIDTTTNLTGETVPVISWIPDKKGGCEWYYPNPGENSRYTINVTDSDGNTTHTYSGVRNGVDTLDLRDYGFTSVNGSITALTYDGIGTIDLTQEAEIWRSEDGLMEQVTNLSGIDKAKNALALEVTDSTNNGVKTFNFNWLTPTRTPKEDLPSLGDELTVEYEHDANTFTLTDDGSGIIDLLGLNDDVTEAEDAELELDGEKIYRASNYIGEDYGNTLIKGMTIQLKGVGEVSIDVAHDAQKAVESIQTFVDTYNDLMSWINTRMTESQVDKDVKATIDSDDFRMRWGLLHGNSLLRQTKSNMRSIISQNYTFSFTQRTSSEEIYGTMAHNGLKGNSTLRLRIGNKFADLTIEPTDTLQTIVAKINDDSIDGPMRSIYYDDSGQKLDKPLLKASVENDRLMINSTDSNAITISGSAAMNALKINYTYRGLYQMGISTTSNDYGKSGEIEFDTEAFMEALEENPDEVQEMMVMFANDMYAWTRSMINSSETGETSGTLTREIENLDNQINSINEYLEKYQDRLDRQEESLRKKYAAAEQTISKLSQQANSIAAILNQLNGYANNKSSS